jgi:integrase/recombinase XerC
LLGGEELIWANGWQPRLGQSPGWLVSPGPHQVRVLRVVERDGRWGLAGAAASRFGVVDEFLGYLADRGYSPRTVRAYAFDLLNFFRFLAERDLELAGVVPTDLFEWLEWQARPRSTAGSTVVRLGAGRGASPATINRRVAAVRGLFEYAVTVGACSDNPVPAPRRAGGLRDSRRRGELGHLERSRSGGGRLVRQPRRLPESLEPEDVAAFLTDLNTHRDRAMVLGMLLGGLRAGEVRSLLLANIDMGMRRVRVVGKGERERIIPVDAAFFAEVAVYLRDERPAGCDTPECFVVLRGPTRGRAMTEAGMRSIFRIHRVSSGALRVRPHRLRHTYGTELAAAGIDLLVLRELMGHASPETTAGYVHLTAETLAAEYSRARSRS